MENMELKFDVVLLGATGFIADYILKEISDCFSVCAISRTRPVNGRFDQWFSFDDLKKGKYIISAVNCIYNVADKGRYKYEIEEDQYLRQMKLNAPNFTELFKDLSVINVKYLITMGSSEEYGITNQVLDEKKIVCPVTSYGVSKVSLLIQAQAWAALSVGIYTHLRPFVVFGKNQNDDMFIPSMIRTLKNGQDFAMTGGEQFRYFTYAGTIGNVIKYLLTHPPIESEILNIIDCFYFTIKNVARMIECKINRGRVLLGKLPYRDYEVWDQKVPSNRLNFLAKPKDSFEKLLGEVINYELQG